MENNYFDYIIIGAGSAGCVLANRLSENAQYRVLLLEAGGSDWHPFIKIPAFFSKLFRTSNDWGFTSVPQKGLHDRRLYQVRGKVLGGSSSLNAMLYVRGHQRDYDQWAAKGNAGWAYSDVLPFFKKAENNHTFENEYHAKGGNMHISHRPYTNPMTELYLQAVQELGYPLNEDINGSSQEGFTNAQTFQKEGSRWSSADAFLHAAEKRPNLRIVKNATVEKIVIENKIAKGVQWIEKGKTRHTAHARKEVILSAGAFGSPQILQLSGIGDADYLKQVGVAPILDLKGVGQNFHDHLIAFTLASTSFEGTLDKADKFPEILGNTWEYLVNKRGAATSNVAEAIGFLKSSPDEPQPDIQFHFGPAYFLEHGFQRPEGHGYSCGALVTVPKSRGSVLIKSNNPMDSTWIDPNHLAHEEDIRKSIWGYQQTQAMLTANAFRPYFKGMFLPTRFLESDEEILHHIRKTSENLYHPVGTCKMGQGSDAVVNEKLQVHGIGNLRVVDASIMPDICSGNTNAPTIMIGEKGADMILKG